MTALYQTSIRSLPLIGRGKVRDLYAVGDDKLLMIASDRLSAFDVVMSEPIPEKGVILNRMSEFWFAKLAHIVPNHLTGIDPETVVTEAEVEQVRGRAVVAKRLKPLPIEAVVRGYLIGGGWKDYQATGSVCGIALPKGLSMASRLPEPIFTPAHKAEAGQHDENISFEEVVKLIGEKHANEIRRISLALYNEAAAYALEQGIIVADTKFEFGLDDKGVIHLMDEVLTADSSRYWPADGYAEGISPPSFDKQFVRDYLETLDWDKTAPAPELPARVIAQTADKYREALYRIAGVRMPVVGVVMGSQSDWEVMRHAVEILDRFGIPHEARVVSAHRMPDALYGYAESAHARGFRAIIAGAGGAAHLPGMLASKTTVPVLGVPVPSKYLRGEDSLYSIVQMPKGIPVATFAIGEAGAANAALHVIATLATQDDVLRERLEAFRMQQTEAAHSMNATLGR
ncbi:MAG: phosphoribosylaminoimidazolesuccinocarboxamide synthase [Betaproteobacteria bacterium]|nr:phosphoribosylaminoimidazolesuccinocarboxamide synthase [Betaproteobacteria bacterium]